MAAHTSTTNEVSNDSIGINLPNRPSINEEITLNPSKLPLKSNFKKGSIMTKANIEIKAETALSKNTDKNLPG